MGSKVGVDEGIDGHLEIFGKILSLLKNQSNTQYHNRLVRIYLTWTSILLHILGTEAVLFLVFTCWRQTISSPIFAQFVVRFLNNYDLQHFTLTRKLRFVPFPAKDGKVFEKISSNWCEKTCQIVLLCTVMTGFFTACNLKHMREKYVHSFYFYKELHTYINWYSIQENLFQTNLLEY